MPVCKVLFRHYPAPRSSRRTSLPRQIQARKISGLKTLDSPIKSWNDGLRKTWFMDGHFLKSVYKVLFRHYPA